MKDGLDELCVLVMALVGLIETIKAVVGKIFK